MAFDRSLRRAACVLLTAALLVPAWGGLARQVRAAAQSEIDALKAEQAESQVRQDHLLKPCGYPSEDLVQLYPPVSNYRIKRHILSPLQNPGVFQIGRASCRERV